MILISRKSLGLLLKVLLTAAVVYFVANQVVGHWAEISGYRWQLDWIWLVLSILAALCSLLVIAFGWKGVVGSFGHDIPVRKCFRIFYLADLGRYIPGKIWALLGVLYLAKQEGVQPEQATASFVIHQFFCIPISFLIMALAIQFESDAVATQGGLWAGVLSAQSLWLVGVCLIPIILLISWPRPIIAVANFVLRLVKRPTIAFHLDKKVALQVLVRYFLGWLGYGVAFYLFVRAVVPDASLGLLAAAGIYNASYQIGYLTLFAPGGIGSRELAMQAMLEPFVGPIAPAIAILARLWVIVIEIVAALIALSIRK
ncbi:MAG: lysylphosphatidylglycerol synthase transmembrane domain-containing protein [bacterium]